MQLQLRGCGGPPRDGDVTRATQASPLQSYQATRLQERLTINFEFEIGQDGEFATRSGAKGQTRTADRTIFSRELYQLSYLGTVGDRGLEPLTSTV
jgi:hypothetical protein